MVHFHASLSAQRKQQKWLQKMESSSAHEGDRLVFNLLRQMQVHEDLVGPAAGMVVSIAFLFSFWGLRGKSKKKQEKP